MGAWQLQFIPFIQSKRAKVLKENEEGLKISSCSLSTPPPHLVYHLSRCFSLCPPIYLSFSLVPHSLPSLFLLTVSSQCKRILPWETFGPLSVDFWPGFHNDAKQATRTSQCDVMAGCPMNTRARTKWDCQCCPWCMHIQTVTEVHTWAKRCFFFCFSTEKRTYCNNTFVLLSGI